MPNELLKKEQGLVLKFENVVTLIDSSIVTINPYLDELIELAMIERIGKFVFGGYFASNNSMYYFNPQ